MPKIAIVIGNPLHDSYSEALGKAYQRGAESGGHQVTLFALGQMNFDAILREGYRREQALEPDLVVAREEKQSLHHFYRNIAEAEPRAFIFRNCNCEPA